MALEAIHIKFKTTLEKEPRTWTLEELSEIVMHLLDKQGYLAKDNVEAKEIPSSGEL